MSSGAQCMTAGCGVTLPGDGQTCPGFSAGLKLPFYVYQGRVKVGENEDTVGHLAYLGKAESIELSARQPSGLLRFGGRPLNEPMAHHGPLLMNTPQEINQAFRDYQKVTLIPS